MERRLQPQRRGGDMFITLAVSGMVLAFSRDPAPIESLGSPATPAAADASVLFPKTHLSNALAVNLGLGSAVGEFGVTWQLAGLGPVGVELGMGDGFSGTQA